MKRKAAVWKSVLVSNRAKELVSMELMRIRSVFMELFELCNRVIERECLGEQNLRGRSKRFEREPS